jgi:hypothetical protein
MGIAPDRKNVSVEARIKVLYIMNAMHNFVSGENFFRPMLGLQRKQYIQHAKDTLKFFNLAAFT